MYTLDVIIFLCYNFLDMSIIYAVIGLKSTILCEFTTSTGNFPLIALEVLKACDGRKYVKYAANNYMFYVLNV